jgi:hypothetical protein
MKNEDSAREGQENEKKEDRSKKLGDKLGPARNDPKQQRSKELEKELHPNEDRENEEDKVRNETH